VFFELPQLDLLSNFGEEAEVVGKLLEKGLLLQKRDKLIDHLE
jgi:hypothetical protein